MKQSAGVEQPSKQGQLLDGRTGETMESLHVEALGSKKDLATLGRVALIEHTPR